LGPGGIDVQRCLVFLPLSPGQGRGLAKLASLLASAAWVRGRASPKARALAKRAPTPHPAPARPLLSQRPSLRNPLPSARGEGGKGIAECRAAVDDEVGGGRVRKHMVCGDAPPTPPTEGMGSPGFDAMPSWLKDRSQQRGPQTPARPRHAPLSESPHPRNEKARRRIAATPGPVARKGMAYSAEGISPRSAGSPPHTCRDDRLRSRTADGRLRSANPCRRARRPRCERTRRAGRRRAE